MHRRVKAFVTMDNEDGVTVENTSLAKIYLGYSLATIVRQTIPPQ